MAHGADETERLRADLDAMTREYHYQRGVIDTLRQERADECDRHNTEVEGLKHDLSEARDAAEHHRENAKAAQQHAEAVSRQFTSLLEIARELQAGDTKEARRLAALYFKEHP